MSHPPPPGLRTSSPSTPPQPHPSLPARPPPPAGAPPSVRQAASAHPRASGGAPGPRGYGDHQPPAAGGFAFTPRSVNPSPSAWSASTAASASPSYAPAPPTYGGHPPSSYDHPYYGPHQTEPYSQTAGPMIQNPFPAPNQTPGAFGRGGDQNSGYGPEMEAQIAQWQSAYAAKGDLSGGKSLHKPPGSGAATPSVAQYGARFGHAGTDTPPSGPLDKGAGPGVDGAEAKQKTVVRSGGGQTWQDASLLEWDPAHPRLFIGNLAGEVTDDSLLKAFSRYPSVSKARVIRDKRTTKSKGFGFVSFANGDDYFRAAQEMQGKYIGSHPVQIKRSTTEIKATSSTDRRKHGKHGNGGKGGGGARAGGKGGAGGHAHTGAGIQKKQGKTKGGLRILG